MAFGSEGLQLGEAGGCSLCLQKRLFCRHILYATASFSLNLVPPGRFEHPAPGLGIPCSIHLSYGGKV